MCRRPGKFRSHLFNCSIERLTDMWCDELKEHRLTGYRSARVRVTRYHLGQEEAGGPAATVPEEEGRDPGGYTQN